LTTYFYTAKKIPSCPYQIAHGLTDYDPAQAVAKQLPAQKVKHHAALIG
jgi:hypothetical protein